MNNQNVAIRVKELRKRKGYSQEYLAEESKLSLRTIQRIEKGESIPRGDTLLKLTQSLEVSPDDLLELELLEDRSYLQLLNWSALSFVVQPLLGIIVPLVIWVLKRGKVKFADDSGKRIINFQITWILILNSFLMLITLWFDGSLSMLFNFNMQKSFYALLNNFSILTATLFVMYLYNILFILLNVRRSQKGMPNRYFPAIPFLR